MTGLLVARVPSLMESLTKAKTDIPVHLAQTYKAAVILLQKTHVIKESFHPPWCN